MKRTIVGLGITLAVYTTYAAEIQHSFNSPSFSGVGYSSHVLTLKQLEDQQKDKNKAAIDALKAAAEREAANTPQARFKASMETRVYSELAKRISDSLFGSTTTAPTCNGGGSSSSSSPCAAIELVGQNISWWITGSNIIVRIQDANDPNTYTEMTMPYAAFSI